MADKTCSRCGIAKPLSEFRFERKRSSHHPWCHPCERAYQKQWRVENAAHLAEYRRANRAHILERMREYDLRPERRANRLQRMAEWREQNRDKIRVQNRANHAIATGEIQVASACERCGSVNSLDKHHPDYSKPLEVVWLCKSCHLRLHAAERT